MVEAHRTVGRYEIVSEIGRGGMAVVYLGRQPDLDRDVAIKELASFYAADPSFVQRFLRESRIAGSLSHPNIVTVYDFFEHDETLYIAMEYVPRGSLRPIVGSLSLAQAAGVLEGVLSALSYAAGRGIVHRDLKPENLLVTQEGGVKIADFGIAKVYDAQATGPLLTATGTTVGTPHYMAPEQALGQEIGPQADLYSVGVIAYEMLVGRVPFDAPTPAAVLVQHLNEPIPPPRSLKPDLDPGIASWLEAMLVKAPENRVAHPEQAWDMLDELVMGVLGPRWRRAARLPAATESAQVSRPLTPAPFPERGGETIPAERLAESRGAATVLAGSDAGSGAVAASTRLAGASSGDLASAETALPPAPSARRWPGGLRGRRLGMAVAGAVALVAVAAVAAVVALGGGGGGSGQEPELLWKLKAGGFVGSSPTVSAAPGAGLDSARLFFGSQNQNVYSVDAATGNVLWRLETGRTVFSSPAVASGVVYVGSHDGNLYAIDERTGDERWRFQTESTVQSSPAVAGGTVVVGSDDGRVYGVTTGGDERWRFETGGPVFSSPAIDDGTVYVGSKDGHVYALDAGTGKKRWRFATGNEVWSSPAVGQDTVYVGSNDGKLYALDAATGKQRWSFTTGDVVSSSPVVDGGSVFVGSFDHKVYSLNALTGDERWSFETGDTVFSSPTVSQGVLYVGSHDKHLYAVDAATGEELWRYETGGLVGSSPSVFGGVVFVGSDDGNVYALELPAD